MADVRAFSPAQSGTRGPITDAERQQRALAAFESGGASSDAGLDAALDALVLFDEQYIFYFSGFKFIPTERPVGLIITRDGARTLFVPRLELEHAEQTTTVESVVTYPEYPGEVHPLSLLVDHLQKLAVSRVGADHDGYPVVAGYRPFALSQHLEVSLVSPALDAQMALKSEHELALIRESVYWGDVAHHLLQDYTKPGLGETEVVARACSEATEQMKAVRGGEYQQVNRWINGALAIYRGQIGANSALPHAMTNDAVFKRGDTLVTGAGADVFGYLSELERTMFIGEPSSDQRRYFQHMLALQDIAFETMKPGVRASDVDRAVTAYYQREGLQATWRHHVGHSLGQCIHESPFLDVGDDRELLPGMVFSVEPGIYVPDLGGFRHSDTVLITEDGLELLTYYPRDLESLVLSVN